MTTNKLFENEEMLKEFLFISDKHIGDLTLNKISTNIQVTFQSVRIEKQSRYLGWIKRPSTIQTLPITNIAGLKVRKVMNLSDMVLGSVMVVLGFGSPLFWIFAILFFWMGFSNKIIITTNLQTKIKIPVDSTREAQAFIAELNGIPTIKGDRQYAQSEESA